MGADSGRLRATVLSAALVVGGGSAVAWALTHQNPDPPAPPSSAAAPVQSPSGPAQGGGAPASPEPSEGRGSDTPSSSSPSPSTSTEPRAEPEAEAMPQSTPTRVRVDGIEVDAPLQQLGLQADGTLEVPAGAQYDVPAWYEGSPTPGERGPSVIEGHVTGFEGAPSVFFRLGELRPGDTVEVDREDGTTARFEVYSVEQYPKDAFPTESVYGNTDGPELRLITCGGSVSDETGHHVDNVVVYARAT